MSAFVVPLSVFLAVVFGLSVVGKLRSPDHGRASFDALQIPVRYPHAAATAVIVAEAVVALALIVTSGWVFVGFAAAALVLTGALLVVVIRAHRRGVTDDCGCFGDWLPSAIGPSLIARNAMLTSASLALLVSAFVTQELAGAPTGVLPALTSPSPSVMIAGAVLAAGVIAASVWSIARAARSSTASSSPASSSTAGSRPRGAGSVVVPVSGTIIDLLAPGPRARLLVFVSPGCHACKKALAALSAAQRPLTALVDVYVVQRATQGPTDVLPSHTLPPESLFALDVGGSLSAILDVGPGTPVAVLIGTDGQQAGPLASGSEETAELADSIRSLASAPPA